MPKLFEKSYHLLFGVRVVEFSERVTKRLEEEEEEGKVVSEEILSSRISRRLSPSLLLKVEGSYTLEKGGSGKGKEEMDRFFTCVTALRS